MRPTVVAIALCISVLAGPALSQLPSELADALTLKVSAYSVEFVGERELEAAASARMQSERTAALKAARRLIKPGETIQLLVELQNSDGSRTTVTSDPRIRYESLGCFTVSDVGLVTAVPSGKCYSGKLPELWIALVSADGKTLAWNRIFFRYE